ncbi:hypothetical protein SteCoe_10242 [Stentor coeruleus]|uniref:Dephospho-CoA kinase n=1 Tax=Stentor coeruleus TaxID=5963 RepID=A0A1R2CFX5_9CILI|nr:hypothetical protein SteCoe_10242 [Stentor coeruleus]
MDIASSICLNIIAFFCGLTTQRCKKNNTLLPIVILCTLGFAQGYIFKHFTTTKKITYILSACLLISNILGRNLEMIGLTGGIASGKSTVINTIKENFKNIGIIDCDAIAKEVVTPDKRAYRAIVKAFGKDILAPSGELNRDKLANLIFSDKNARTKLNRIIQPYIFFEIIKRVLGFRIKGVSNVVLDAPLLFESKILTYFCCPIITVYVKNNDLWLERLCKRDSINVQKAQERIACQMPIEQKIQKSDIVVDNSGTLSQLEAKLITVFGKITNSK